MKSILRCHEQPAISRRVQSSSGQPCGREAAFRGRRGCSPRRVSALFNPSTIAHQGGGPVFIEQFSPMKAGAVFISIACGGIHVLGTAKINSSLLRLLHCALPNRNGPVVTPNLTKGRSLPNNNLMIADTAMSRAIAMDLFIWVMRPVRV